MKINPILHPIKKAIRIPGSKSCTNRALILAALTKGSCYLKNPLYCEDTEAMISCLKALGLEIQKETDHIIVHNDISSLEEKNIELDARESGTTARFLLALLCLVPGSQVLKGSLRLSERPISDLIDGLRQLGANIQYCKKENELPVKITSSTLFGDSLNLKSQMSSQFCSALLMIAPYLKGCTISVENLISKPYVELTRKCMEQWGVTVLEKNSTYFVPQKKYQKKEYVIEGDFSSAGYFFAIAALTKSSITIENLSFSSLQPDRKFLEILIKMGSIITYEENKIHIQGNGVLPLDIDMEHCPDQVMTMAVLAAFAKGTTKISGVRSLRVKESERILALKNELKKMNIETEDTHDTLTIFGGNPKKATIEPYNDHRIAMSFAIAATSLPNMIINNPSVVKKTFPTFWEVINSL